MQKSYIVIDDTGLNHKHGGQFETVESASAYILKHDLQCTHLIYDLSRAPTVLPEYK